MASSREGNELPLSMLSRLGGLSRSEKQPITLSDSLRAALAKKIQYSNKPASSFNRILDGDGRAQPSKEEENYKTNDLHPYTRPLTLADAESCVILENAAYPDPQDRASREKVLYQLSKCGELCMGLFCTLLPFSDMKPETLATSKLVETNRPNGAVSVLLGHSHITAVMTDNLTTIENSFDFPGDWASKSSEPSIFGHREAGRTIVLQSVAVLPEFRGRGIGKILVTAYKQQMNSAGIADDLAVLCHENTVAWFEKFGFINQGLSNSQHGSGGWYKMTVPLAPEVDPTSEY
uniref:Bgt-3702 n=1 Tax=Blumeria graminis f. sp. tritici 96224 TaxID=1268274 RepID=A0A381L3F5_BLUGR